MSKKTLAGQVTEALPNAMFAVQLRDGRKILARVSGSLDMRAVRVIPGDSVEVEISEFDPKRGKIVAREH